MAHWAMGGVGVRRYTGATDSRAAGDAVAAVTLVQPEPCCHWPSRVHSQRTRPLAHFSTFAAQCGAQRAGRQKTRG